MAENLNCFRSPQIELYGPPLYAFFFKWSCVLCSLDNIVLARSVTVTVAAKCYYSLLVLLFRSSLYGSSRPMPTSNWTLTLKSRLNVRLCSSNLFTSHVQLQEAICDNTRYFRLRQCLHLCVNKSIVTTKHPSILSNLHFNRVQLKVSQPRQRDDNKTDWSWFSRHGTL